MSEKVKFKDALKQAAIEVAGNGSDAGAKLVDAIDAGEVKTATLEQLADGVARFLPKFRANTNVGTIDWSGHIALLKKSVEPIVHKLGL